MDHYEVGSALEEIQASSRVTDSYPPSIAPITTLKRLLLKDLRPTLHHRGFYVLVQIQACLPFRGGVGVVEDERGNVVAVRIVHQDGKRIYNEYWGNAKFLVIKEPFYTAIAGSSMGSIRVHHLTDVAVISPSDLRLPTKWQLRTEKTADQWRQLGNKSVKEKQFYPAIECYNEALCQARSQEDIVTIRLNRCHARISIQCFDSALEDANAVLATVPDKEKALFRKAEALYQLRLFKDAERVLYDMTTLFPGNHTAHQRMERVGKRLEEEAGLYDFAGMLDENLEAAKSDRASFLGPVEVKACKAKSRGRGLFLTNAVKAGELLLCEKAFSVSRVSIHDHDDALPGHRSDDARNHLHNDCVFQFHRNPSLLPPFQKLHSGYYTAEKTASVDGEIIIDGFLVRTIVDLNCYNFFQSREFHRRLAHAEPDLLDQPKSTGIWIYASYINHSCLPNVETAFIGDMIIVRAAKDLNAGSELTYCYTGILENYEERQRGLGDYAFHCTCRRCLNDKDVPPECHEKRNQILSGLELENRKLAISKMGTTMKRIEKLLDDFDKTYTIPASQLPRPEIFMELFISIRNFDSWDMPAEVVTLVHRLLLASGFHLRCNRKRFQIMQWGSLSDLTVASIAYMWNAYGGVNPAVCDDVEEALKTAYEIVVGERSSFESVYREMRPIPSRVKNVGAKLSR